MEISTFIILKNEEQTILRTLRSAVRFSAEIIIGVDDSTTDRSIDVIGDFLPEFDGEVEIFEFCWNDDFAGARNRAIAKCTKEWIFQLDAHEYLKPGDEEKLLELIEKLPEDIFLVALEMWDEWQDGQPNSRFYQDHLWRSGKGIVYTGAMHNYISRETCSPKHRVKVPGIVIYHQRTSENDIARKSQRLEMSKKIFLPKVENDPSDLRSIFYLAQSFLNSEILEEAEKYYLLYIERSLEQKIPNPCEHAWACYKAGLIASIRGEHNLALDRFLEGLKHRADSPEIYFALGETFMMMKKNREAERFLIIAANMKPDEDHLFRYGLAMGHGPWLRLMQLYYDEENYPAAFRAGMEGIRRTPENRQLLEGVRTSLTAAAEKIEKQDKTKKNLYIVDASDGINERLIEEWEKEYNVIIHQRVDFAYMKWADITYVEGCTLNLLDAAQHRFNCCVIVRVNASDLYQPGFKQINWENIDTLIFASEKTRDTTLMIAGKIPCKTEIIERCIDTDRFTLLQEVDPLSLAWIGEIHWRENLSYLLELLSETEEPYILHIVGEFQDEEYKDIILYQIKTLRLEKRVVFHGRQDDINTFLDEIKPRAILSASTSTEIPLPVLEAMAKGIQPIVYNYQGVDKDLPSEAVVFCTNHCAALRFKKFVVSSTFREFVMLNNSLKGNIKLLNAILKI